MVAAGWPYVFVASAYSGSITEIDASTGAVLRVIPDSRFGPDAPRAMFVDGPDLFVADGYGGALTELDVASGAVVRVISGGEYDFVGPYAIAAYGPDLLVGDAGSGTTGSPSYVTEVDAATGALVRVVTGPRYHFYGPGAMALDGQDLFVLNDGSPASGGTLTPPPTTPSTSSAGSLTEIDATTGALVRVISGPRYDFSYQAAMAAGGPHVFVVGGGFSGTVTEFPA
jgi:hypothetical protein